MWSDWNTESSDGRQRRRADRLLCSLWIVLLEPFDQDYCQRLLWHYQSSVRNSQGQTAQGWMVVDTQRRDRGIKWQLIPKATLRTVKQFYLAFNASFSSALGQVCVCVCVLLVRLILLYPDFGSGSEVLFPWKSEKINLLLMKFKLVFSKTSLSWIYNI